MYIQRPQKGLPKPSTSLKPASSSGHPKASEPQKASKFPISGWFKPSICHLYSKMPFPKWRNLQNV